MTDPTGSPIARGRVLVVCTGNVCRSPYVERRLAQLLAGTGLTVTSAGTGALVGEPVDQSVARLLERVGASAVGFAARQLTPQLVAEADLVLAATREHRSHVVQMHPKALSYCFTIGDFADMVGGLDGAGAGIPEPNTSWAAHVAKLAAARRGTIAPRSGDESDIPDPFRQGPGVFERMARSIEAGLPAIVAALTPPIGGPR